MLGHALDWASRNFYVFPLHPGTKRPVWKGWLEHATTDPERIKEIWAERPYNVGVLTDGMICVDVDVKDGRNGIISAFDLGLPFETLTVRTTSGGLHLYYSGPDVSNSVGTLGDGLDVRSHHGFVVAPGSVYRAGRYELLRDLPMAPFPEALLPRLNRPRVREAPLVDVELDEPSAVDHARNWLRSHPVAVEGQGGDDHTYRTALKLRDFGLSEPVALDLLLAWNEGCLPSWDADDLKTKVANAYAYGKNPPGVASPQRLFAGVYVPEPDVPRPGRQWFDEGDDHRGAVEWLYQDTLPSQGVCILNGQSNAGKTFVALYSAKSLAVGTPFFGLEPAKPGGTLILAGEAYGSMKLRMAALREPDKRLPIAATYVGALAARGAWETLCDDARAKAAQMLEAHGVPVRLVILDTLSSSGILAKEDDNAEAATVMKAFGELSVAMNALVVVLHHPPKNGVGERGASAIRNNADYVMTITREGEDPVRDIDITKSRDGECRALGTFTLLPVAVDGGKTMTVSPGEPRAKQSRASAKAERFQRMFDEVYAGDPHAVDGRRAVRIDALRALIASRMTKPDKPNIRRAIREACASGRVEEIEASGVAYLAERPLFDLPVVMCGHP